MGRRLTYLILAAGVVIALFFGWNAWRNSRTLSDAEMLKRLPTADSAVMAINFAQIRRSSAFGELAASKVPEDPDYQGFVRDTGFDYKRDLEYALVALSEAGNFFVVRGHFDWNRLQAYVRKSGGSCYQDLCHMPGSVPERRISFLPLAPDVIGIAVGSSETAASQLMQSGKQRAISVPAQPVWVSIPGSAAARGIRSLPGPSGLLTSMLGGVNEVTLTLGPQGDALEARMEAQCKTAQDAANLTGQLMTLNSLLKGTMSREKKTPDARDLTGVLSAGQIHQSDRVVYGEWTLQKAFLDNLAGM